MAIVDSSGTVQQTEKYDVYGQATAGTNSHPTEYQFAGQQTDATGLQYLRARYYDPSTGRFLNQDPKPGYAMNPAKYSRYGYAASSPAIALDPAGLDPNCPSSTSGYGDYSCATGPDGYTVQSCRATNAPCMMTLVNGAVVTCNNACLAIQAPDGTITNFGCAGQPTDCVFGSGYKGKPSNIDQIRHDLAQCLSDRGCIYNILAAVGAYPNTWQLVGVFVASCLDPAGEVVGCGYAVYQIVAWGWLWSTPWLSPGWPSSPDWPFE
jgi:RHS repeat-associated protein